MQLSSSGGFQASTITGIEAGLGRALAEAGLSVTLEEVGLSWVLAEASLGVALEEVGLSRVLAEVGLHHNGNGNGPWPGVSGD